MPHRIAALFLLPVCLFALETRIIGAEPDLNALIRDIQTGTLEARRKAADELANLGPEAAPAVSAIVKALKDSDLQVRVDALAALEHIGPEARGAVPALIEVLNGSDVALKPGALQALAGIGHDARQALPALRKFAAASDQASVSNVAFALARVAPADGENWNSILPKLVALLSDKRTHVRSEASAALVEIGAPAVPVLADIVKGYDQNPDAAIRAAATLQLIGPAAGPAVPALLDALKARQERVVMTAADALGAIGPPAKSAVPELKKLLGSRLATVRGHAAGALGELGPDAVEAVPELTKAVADTDPDVRREAVEALGNIGPAAKAAAPALVKALDDLQGTVTLHAAAALGRLGAAAVPDLITLMQNPKQRHWSIMILADIGPEASAAVPALLAVVKSDAEFEVRREAMLALSVIGPGAAAAIPDLIKILEDETSPARAGAVFALVKIGARQVIPTLAKTINDPKNKMLREVSAWGLLTLEPDNPQHAAPAMPVLVNGLQHEIDVVRLECARAISRLGPVARVTAPSLIKAIEKEQNPLARREFLIALGRVNPDVREALPVIKKALTDPEPIVSYTAYYALGSLGPAVNSEVPLLLKNLEAKDERLQVVSAWALVKIAPEREGVIPQAIPLLIRGLQLPDPRARHEVALTLGSLGSAAKSALPALRTLEQDTDETVRKAAVEAVKKISG